MSKPHKKWIKLDSRVAYENKYFQVIEDNALLPNKEIVSFSYISRLPGVIIAPLLDWNQAILVRQYRYIIEQDSWEFPAGGIHPGETPLDAARRELEEETGYLANELTLMNKVYTSNGTTDEVIYIYFARKLLLATQKLEITEADMIVKSFSMSECMNMVLNGTISCAQTILTLMCLQQFLPTNR